MSCDKAKKTSNKIRPDFLTHGDLVVVPLEAICNKSKYLAQDVKVHISVPDGLEYESDNLTRGALTVGEGGELLWYIGNLTPGSCVEYSFITVRVTDHCVDKYVIKYKVVGGDGGCETCGDDDCIIIEPRITCCDIIKCVTMGELDCSGLTA